MEETQNNNNDSNAPKPIQKRVLAGFSLYGFLKNQRYFEPFIVLAFMEKGLSFFMIGLLIGFRELSINLLEIPSGAVADLYGRRRTMIFSFACYTVSFIVFAISGSLIHLFGAMFLFAVGEAFRTGTHKAIIFDYLASRNQQQARTRIYGYTRSWSKMGESLSALIAGGLVLWRGNFGDIFWLCAIPSSLNIINFMFYPKTDNPLATGANLKGVFKHTFESLKEAWVNKKQRNLIIESGGFEGIFKIVKDYLQLVIKAAAVSIPLFAFLADDKRTAVLIGIIYSLVFLLSSVASRKAHVISQLRGGDENAAGSIWMFTVFAYAMLVVLLGLHLSATAVVLFVLLYLLENIWRPLLVSRINECSQAHQTATTLSIESQFKSLVAMAAAPLIGFGVDRFGLLAVPVVGLGVSLLFFVKSRFSPTSNK